MFFYLKAFKFYAHYEGEIKKWRFILIALSPFIFIPLLPLLVVIMFEIKMPYISLMSTLNVLLSSVDLLGSVIIMFRVPNGAVIRNRGFESYYKKL